MVYEKPPWVFRGKALYQLQLVKSEEARKYIPEQFKLVELFGYTLGGFYLARYDDSPAGSFDELVAMAGLVWNAPTSCAWAARVYVNNREARDHGVHHVGLPSRLATFKVRSGSDGAFSECAGGCGSGRRSWWSAAPDSGVKGSGSGPQQQQGGQRVHKAEGPVLLELRNVDTGRGRALSVPVCQIELPGADRPAGPRISLSLPSFSGATPEVPGLLRYACDLRTNVGLVAPMRLVAPSPARGEEDSPECLAAVLGGRPLVALEFARMEMHVDEPEALTIAPASQQEEQRQRWAAAKPASLTAAWAAKLVAA